MAISVKQPSPLAVIVLAAGKGKRMNNPEMAKVMYEIHGKPMIDYVVQLTKKVQCVRTLLVVGWQKQSIIDYISGSYSNIEFVEQVQQLGTGHAVLQTKAALEKFDGDVLVLSGDVPLLSEKTVSALVGYHRSSEATATILSAEFDDPSGYGRIIRHKDGSVKRIVEDKDAAREELAVKEINSGIYVFNKQKLYDSLDLLKPNNAQGEYYLTDVFEFFWKNNWRVSAVKAIDPLEVRGINTAEQLESARIILEKENKV